MTGIVLGASVLNAGALAVLLGAMAGSWGAAVAMLVVTALAVGVTFLLYNWLLFRGVDARQPSAREEARLPPWWSRLSLHPAMHHHVLVYQLPSSM